MPKHPAVTVRGRQASVIKRSVYRTEEGATVAAPLGIVLLASYGDQIKRLRNNSGVIHHESIEISWNAFNGIAIFFFFDY